MQLWILDTLMNSNWIKALSWTFMHSLWLGLLAAVLAAMVIALTKTTRPGVRYNLLGIVILLFVAAIVVTFCKEYSDSKAGSTASLLVPVNGTDDFQVINNTESEPADYSGGVLSTLTEWYESNASMFMIAWIFFFFINCIKLVVGFASVQRLRQYQTFPVPDEWTKKFEQLLEQLRISKPVVLLQSGCVKMPVALGVLKPVILLPVGLITHIPPEQVESILLHELGHIRRRDYLVNILQHFTEAIFFFNPGILWISSLLRQEREACCDDIVVQYIRHKGDYLEALVAFQEYSNASKPYVMAIAGKKQYLLNRVKRMLTSENKRLSISEKLALLGGLLIFSAFTLVKQNKGIDEAIATAVKSFGNAQEYEVTKSKITLPADFVQSIQAQNDKTQKNKEDNKLKQSIRTSNAEYQIESGIEKHGDYDVSDAKSKFSSRQDNAIRFASNEVIVKKEQLNYRTALTGLKFKINEKIAVPANRFVLKDTSLEKVDAERRAVLAEIADIKETLGELKKDNAEMEEYKKTLTPADRVKEEELDREINAIRREIDRLRANLEGKRAELQRLTTLIRKFNNNQERNVSKINPKGIGAPPAKVYQLKAIEFKPPAYQAKSISKNNEAEFLKKDVTILLQPQNKVEPKETKLFNSKSKNWTPRSSSEIHKPEETHRTK